MIITRTPFRVSFAGGGSDLPDFYHRHKGCVLSTSINKYMYIYIHPTFNRENTVVKYSRTETVDDVRKICHPIARQLLLNFKMSGVEIVSTADIPAGTGLSTSSAYTVGLIHALYAFKGKYASQEKIARKACMVEIGQLGEPIGKQDQYGTAVGGLKLIEFFPDEHVEVTPLFLNKATMRELESNLLLFYTGMTHSAGTILKEQGKNIASDDSKFENMVKMTGLAYELKDALTDGRLDDFGKILNEGWRLKRGLVSTISNDTVDKYYDIAIQNGATGGKLLGAGGGGFLLFYCPKERQMRLRAALSDLVELPFSFDFSGTKVIYVGEKDWD